MTTNQVIIVCIISLLIGIIFGILKGFEYGIISFFTSLLGISIIWLQISKRKEKKGK